MTGKDIDLYVSYLRDLSTPGIESAARALQVELRTRYFNQRWLSEMKAHGCDEARNMMFLTDHLDLGQHGHADGEQR
jgi:cobaltochelatase CobN